MSESQRRLELRDGAQAHREIERFVPHRGQQVPRQAFDDATACGTTSAAKLGPTPNVGGS